MLQEILLALIQIRYKSTVGANNWSLFYTEKNENSDGVLDIHLYSNKLIDCLYTTKWSLLP
jgi:hypothetical protein